jgi:hypothetical protein
MTPDGNLTEWMKREVELMIIAGMEKYDVGNTKRHQENSEKLDRIQALGFKLVYLILATMLTAAAGLAVDVILHAMGAK